MISELWPHNLTWQEVDPSRHPFDSAAAAREVRSLGPAHRIPHRPEASAGETAMSTWSWNEGKIWADAMTRLDGALRPLGRRLALGT